jgi:putative phosphoserine phosphatase/1-acylglycerol-3-phosphate O-acyltransferase
VTEQGASRGPRVAAIFDLDRTLLRGASAPTINAVLSEVGLRGAPIPGERLAYRAFDRFGEFPFAMALVRAAVLGVRGWPVDQLRAAGRLAAERLSHEVASYASGLLAEHRRAGHRLALATTTPFDLVEPFAARIGVDDLIATRYASVGGYYTGRLSGGFVWGPGKLSAVREWAGARGVDLAASYAYSDSIHDLPLLSAVGHPFAVNPDLALQAAAHLRRWPVMQLDAPPGVAMLAGFELFDVAKYVLRPELFPYARFDIDGVEHIPDRGPFILAPNHRSPFDVAVLALVAALHGRPARLLGDQALFDAPVVGPLARALGGISLAGPGAPASSFEAARRVLAAGEGLALLVHDTTAAARLAAASKAPVVPVGLHNTEAVWPFSAGLPNVMNLLDPPTVRVRLGHCLGNLGLGPADVSSDSEQISAAISRLLPPLGVDPWGPRAPEAGGAAPGTGSVAGSISSSARAVAPSCAASG